MKFNTVIFDLGTIVDGFAASWLARAIAAALGVPAMVSQHWQLTDRRPWAI
jgi:hypothetical protein